jgi:hypothetical protein
MEKILTVMISSFLFIGLCKADTPAPNDTNDQVRLVSDAYAGIEAAAVHAGDYRLKTVREAQLDLITFREWFFHFGIQETSLFDYSPTQFDHRLYYFKIGYDTPDGRVSFFWDHTCNNPVRKLPEDATNQIHWNEFGLGYETTGMRLGHKNDRINFDYDSQWLNKIDWSTSLSWIWMKNDNDYKYMFKLGLRDDIYRIASHVFYTQFKLFATYDDRGINYNPSVEAGDRIHLGDNLNLVPYLAYEHFHDWYDLGDGENFYLVGLRLEVPLGPDKPASASKNFRDLKDNGQTVVSSRQRKPLRFRYLGGGYNQNFKGTKDRCNSSDVDFDLDLLEFADNEFLTLDTFAGILTKPHKFDIQNVNYKIGPSLNFDLPDYHLRLFHSYSCLYGEDSAGLIRSYNLLGAEIDRDNRIHWSAQAAVFATTTRFDYTSRLQAAMGYDFHPKGNTPYVNGSLNYLTGDDAVFGKAFETGYKFPGELGDFILYYRFEDSFDVFRFGLGNQNWVGFKFVF